MNCPKCLKAQAVVPILYGMIFPYSKDLDVKGEFILGGCVVADEQASHYCKSCDIKFDESGRIFERELGTITVYGKNIELDH